MIRIRPSQERGQVNLGWLHSQHSFSFGHYYDAEHMGHGPLRVINEDRVQPGRGFDTHGHSDMEIISYVLDGQLAHRDSMGNGSTIRPGDVQRMSAGTGVQHSEYNGSQSDSVHFLQIWIQPEAKGLEPGYEERHFSRADKQDRLRLIASREGRDGSVALNQKVDLYASLLSASTEVQHTLPAGHLAWVQVIQGQIRLNGTALQSGDGAAIEQESLLSIEADEDSEFLLFDMKAR